MKKVAIRGNPVFKYLNINKAKAHIDRKKRKIKGYLKHKSRNQRDYSFLSFIFNK